MALTSGKVLFRIPFDNGDTANVYINPHEAGLQERIKNFEASLKNRLENLRLEKYAERFKNKPRVEIAVQNLNFRDLIEMEPEKLETVKDALGAMVDIDGEVNEQVKQEIDSVFNSNVSAELFKYVAPLDMCAKDESGEEFEPYIVLALEALANEITRYNDKMNGAAKKYSDKYSKYKK